MNVNGNQGSRPNYLSTLQKIKLPPRPYVDETHQKWTVSLPFFAQRLVVHLRSDLDFDV